MTVDQTLYLVGDDAICVAAGGVTVSSEANVAITNGSHIIGGKALAGTGCAAAAEGGAIVRASGTTTAPVSAAIQTPGASVDIGVVDAYLSHR